MPFENLAFPLPCQPMENLTQLTTCLPEDRFPPSFYNALSGKLTQRFGRDFTTLFSYTWSKALDDSSAIRGTGNDFGPMNPHCRACGHGPAGFNVPHRFVASVLYNLPFGKGQKF